MRKVCLIATLLFLSGCGGTEQPARQASLGALLGPGRVASFDGVPIAYSVEGSGDAAIVFIHGWSCDQTYWKAQVEAFSETMRVVTIDLAGHGDSGIDRQEWTLQSLGRDVQAVVEELGLETFILVGHSMGGPVSLEAVRLMPGRAIGIVAVDTLHDLEFKWPEEEWKRWLEGYEEDFGGTCRNMVVSMFPKDADQELVEHVSSDMCSGPPDVGTALMYDFQRFDYPTAARAAGVPIRCINAPAFPTQIETNRKYVPDFDAYIMEGVGHFPQLEKPEEFNKLLRQAVEELTSVRSI